MSADLPSVLAATPPDAESSGGRGAVACALCRSAGGTTVWADGFCRVVAIADEDYPGFCRVILDAHVAEMTDLAPAERERLMRVVFATEDALRVLCRPDKINLASFGNMVPHVHWHVIPRWHDDRHFPQPIWGSVQRLGRAVRPEVTLHGLGDALAQRLGGPGYGGG